MTGKFISDIRKQRGGAMANQNSSGWTDELRKEVSELWKSKSAREISCVLSLRGYTFTRNAVQSLVVRMGLSVRDKIDINPSTTNARHPNQVRGAGARVGANAFKVINGIKKQQKLAAMPGIDPEPFVCKEAPDLVPRNLTLQELEPGDCRYVYGSDPATMVFCGHPVLRYQRMGLDRESSYCRAHHFICTAGIPPSGRYYAENGKGRGGVFGRAA